MQKIYGIEIVDDEPVSTPRTVKPIPKPRNMKPIPEPGKSVKQMVKNFEDNIILPPPEFREWVQTSPKAKD